MGWGGRDWFCSWEAVGAFMDRLGLSWNLSSRGRLFPVLPRRNGTASGPPSAVLKKGQRVLIFLLHSKGLQIYLKQGLCSHLPCTL